MVSELAGRALELQELMARLEQERDVLRSQMSKLKQQMIKEQVCTPPQGRRAVGLASPPVCGGRSRAGTAT